MTNALELLTFAHSVRKDVISDVCSLSAAVFEQEKQAALSFLGEVEAKSLMSEADIEAERSKIIAKEGELSNIIRRALQNEASILAMLPEQAKAEVAAEAARFRHAKRIHIFEGDNSPDKEVNELRALKAELQAWMKAVETGTDAETTKMIANRDRLSDIGIVDYLDDRSDARNGRLRGLDRLVAKWIGYEAILAARASWTAFEDRLPAFQAERRDRIQEISDAIQQRYNAFRTAMREKLRIDLNDAMKSVENFEEAEDGRKLLLTRLFKAVDLGQSQIEAMESRLISGDADQNRKESVKALVLAAKARTVISADQKALRDLWLKAEKMSMMTAFIRGHLAFQYEYNIDMDASFMATYRAASWNPNDLFESFKEKVITASGHSPS